MVNKIVHKSMHSTTFWSRSGIQSTQDRFSLNRFNDVKRGQTKKSGRDKIYMADIADIPSNIDNCLRFKNNIEYEWARFI